MRRYALILITVLIVGQSVPAVAETTVQFTQKDFVRLLFQQFMWSDGLPSEPGDRDYLQILSGRRKFRYEAENAYNEATDRVTVRDFQLYGPFSGKGWLMGVSDSTSVNFTTLLPISGTYTLNAVIKGKGFVWNIDNKAYRADSVADRFSEVKIAEIPLKAGIRKIQVAVPPEGAIDSFSFSAEDYPAIQPLKGWRFKEPLTAGRLAEVVVSISGRQEQLPESARFPLRQIAVSEAVNMPAAAVASDAAEFGRFFSNKWLRADYRGCSVQIPLKLDEAGFYQISANLMGERLNGNVNEVQFKATGKPYLEKTVLGLFRMESGDNLITVDLPPMGGIDMLEIRKKSAEPDDFLKLSGIQGPAERPVGVDEAKSLLKNIMDKYPVRK